MADRFERSIRDWYQNSRTTDLEFLDLANPNISDLSNNMTVLYDKLLLHSKVSIKHFYQTQAQLAEQAERIEQRLQQLEQTQFKLLQSLQTIEEEVLINRPLINEEITRLINETPNQPENQEVLQATTKLEDQQKQLLSLVTELKQAVIG